MLSPSSASEPRMNGSTDEAVDSSELNEKRALWLKAGCGAKAAYKLEGGKHLLAAYDGDHSDWCEKCDEGGNLLCCDFCNAVYHPECLDPPMKGVSTAKYWACEECAEDMWCAYSGQPRAARPALPLRIQGDSSSAASVLTNLARFGDDPAGALAALAAGGDRAPSLMSSSKRPRSAFFHQPKPLPKPGAVGSGSVGGGRLRDAKQYIGVAFDPSTGQWHANVVGLSTNGGVVQRGGSGSASKRRESTTRIGPFRDAESAARAYDIAARKELGDTATTNFTVAELHVEDSCFVPIRTLESPDLEDGVASSATDTVSSSTAESSHCVAVTSTSAGEAAASRKGFPSPKAASPATTPSSSPVKGAATEWIELHGLCRSGGGYRAMLLIGSRQRHLGFFMSPVAAARAYDRAATFYLGARANLNFPQCVVPEGLLGYDDGDESNDNDADNGDEQNDAIDNHRGRQGNGEQELVEMADETSPTVVVAAVHELSVSGTFPLAATTTATSKAADLPVTTSSLERPQTPPPSDAPMATSLVSALYASPPSSPAKGHAASSVSQSTSMNIPLLESADGPVDAAVDTAAAATGTAGTVATEAVEKEIGSRITNGIDADVASTGVSSSGLDPSVLDAKKRRVRQMAGAWQPPPVGSKYQAMRLPRAVPMGEDSTSDEDNNNEDDKEEEGGGGVKSGDCDGSYSDSDSNDGSRSNSKDVHSGSNRRALSSVCAEFVWGSCSGSAKDNNKESSTTVVEATEELFALGVPPALTESALMQLHKHRNHTNLAAAALWAQIADSAAATTTATGSGSGSGGNNHNNEIFSGKVRGSTRARATKSNDKASGDSAPEKSSSSSSSSSSSHSNSSTGGGDEAARAVLGSGIEAAYLEELQSRRTVTRRKKGPENSVDEASAALAQSGRTGSATTGRSSSNGSARGSGGSTRKRVRSSEPTDNAVSQEQTDSRSSLEHLPPPPSTEEELTPAEMAAVQAREAFKSAKVALEAANSDVASAADAAWILREAVTAAEEDGKAKAAAAAAAAVAVTAPAIVGATTGTLGKVPSATGSGKRIFASTSSKAAAHSSKPTTKASVAAHETTALPVATAASVAAAGVAAAALPGATAMSVRDAVVAAASLPPSASTSASASPPTKVGKILSVGSVSVEGTITDAKSSALTCGVCGKVCGSGAGLARHNLLHQPKNDPQNSRNNLGKSTSRNSSGRGSVTTASNNEDIASVDELTSSRKRSRSNGRAAEKLDEKALSAAGITSSSAVASAATTTVVAPGKKSAGKDSALSSGMKVSGTSLAELAEQQWRPAVALEAAMVRLTAAKTTAKRAQEHMKELAAQEELANQKVSEERAQARAVLLNQRDAYGWSRAEVLAGNAAFWRCGRDQAAARELLGWPSGRVTEFYYAIWKLSPEYVLWKSSRKSGNTKGNSTSISSSSSGGGSSASSSSSLALTGNATTGAGRPGFPSLGGSGGGAPPAASTVRFRGPRMRSMAAADYRE